MHTHLQRSSAESLAERASAESLFQSFMIFRVLLSSKALSSLLMLSVRHALRLLLDDMTSLHPAKHAPAKVYQICLLNFRNRFAEVLNSGELCFPTCEPCVGPAGFVMSAGVQGRAHLDN